MSDVLGRTPDIACQPTTGAILDIVLQALRLSKAISSPVEIRFYRFEGMEKCRGELLALDRRGGNVAIIRNLVAWSRNQDMAIDDLPPTLVEHATIARIPVEQMTGPFSTRPTFNVSREQQIA